jgi:hypothetical protein
MAILPYLAHSGVTVALVIQAVLFLASPQIHRCKTIQGEDRVVLIFGTGEVIITSNPIDSTIALVSK